MNKPGVSFGEVKPEIMKKVWKMGSYRKSQLFGNSE